MVGAAGRAAKADPDYMGRIEGFPDGQKIHFGNYLMGWTARKWTSKTLPLWVILPDSISIIHYFNRF